MTADTFASSLRRLAGLVSESGYLPQAAWLRECAARVDGPDVEAAQEAARDFIRRVAGMGSLSDLSLKASPGHATLETQRHYLDQLERADALARDLLA